MGRSPSASNIWASFGRSSWKRGSRIRVTPDPRRTAKLSCRTTEACAISSTRSEGGSRTASASRRWRPTGASRCSRTRGCMLSETCRRRGFTNPLKLVLASQRWRLRGRGRAYFCNSSECVLLKVKALVHVLELRVKNINLNSRLTHTQTTHPHPDNMLNDQSIQPATNGDPPSSPGPQSFRVRCFHCAHSPAMKTLVPGSAGQAAAKLPQLCGAAAARALVLEEEAEVLLGELREGSRVAANGALEDEPLLVLQGRGGTRE